MGSDTETEKKKTPLALAPIAKPLAGKKLCKRTLKLVRRGSWDFLLRQIRFCTRPFLFRVSSHPVVI